MNPESILKGRMAESLVSEILREAGNQVYKFGYESTLQNLTQVEKVFDRHSEKGEPFFVEVKFRWHQEWHKDDSKMLKRLSDFWRPIIIFVNCYKKPYFLITKSPYYDKNKELKGWPLEKADYLNIPADIMEKYNALVKKYLTPTLGNQKNKK